MKYQRIVQAEFIERPNRFIAYVELAGRRERVHVKNTGRCRELLTPGAKVYLEESGNPNRSTAYDLVAVEKGERLINIDSQAPNKAVEEWIRAGVPFPDVRLVCPETKYGGSRFDFYIETGDESGDEPRERIFMEVKGVTLEEEGVVRFPDAPSERALKHLEELMRAKKEGYRAIVCFVVQMENVRYFTPNAATHKAFAHMLQEAKRQGVEVMAYDCLVSSDGMNINRPVPVCGVGELEEIPKPLLKWYNENRRILPWREDPSPYRVWVSEIMLQQTRVEAVKPYFERFMKALPDIRSLSRAKEEELLKLWEGLGYYNRVRNLQRAAVRIMEEYGGRMPDRYEELIKLEGIGSYTAGAVASIAYGERRAAVDGNVLRVIARLRSDPRPISDQRVRESVERDVEAILPEERPGDLNQALMELGACVCIPNGAPHCGECPVAKLCSAHRDGCESAYPQKAAPKPRKTEDRTVLVLQDGEKVAIRRRPGRGLLAGLYEPPSLEGFCTAEEVLRYLAGRGLHVTRITPLPEAKHIFTHREWHMIGYQIRVDELEKGEDEGAQDWLYIEPAEIDRHYPIPSAFEAYKQYLHIKSGQKKEV